MAANVFGYAGFIAVAAVVALLVSEMTGNDSIAGIPGAAGTLGTAAAATPLALRSKRRGRRSGIRLGYLIAVAGCGLAFVAGQLGVFWLLVVAMFVMGSGNAANLQNRFAAADLADPDQQARSIAMVVWVGTVGAVAGSPMALWANEIGTSLGVREWATPALLGAVGFGIARVIVDVSLRPDPLEVAGGVDPDAPRYNPVGGTLDTFRVIWPNLRARLAIVAMAVSQMAMVAVMTMTPLHMKDYGQADLSTIVIAVHVLGMFGLAPLIGRWADRVGHIRSLQLGAVILGLGTVSVVIAGYVPALIFIGLFLLGVGWSVALIAGSALLTESLPESSRISAQGLADVLMSLLGAAAAFSSGFVKTLVGFEWLANFATAAALLILIGAIRINARLAAARMG